MGPLSCRARPKALCFVHIHGAGSGSKEIFACLAEGALANGWSAALPGYTLAPEASLTQITSELRSAFDWLRRDGRRARHCGTHHSLGLVGRRASNRISFGPSESGSWIVDLGSFELAPLRDSPQVTDKVKLTEVEVETLSPIRRPSVNKPLSIAYGTSELPAMIATSRDYHAYRSEVPISPAT